MRENVRHEVDKILNLYSDHESLARFKIRFSI
jgi:hypothetical protein